MLNLYLGGCAKLSSPSPLRPAVSSNDINYSIYNAVGYCNFPSSAVSSNLHNIDRILGPRCRARRRVARYDDNDDDDEYGHNVEIALLEMYSETAKEEALLVRAMVDEQEAQVLIFKGFSSSLSNETSADPTRSILPERAVIKSIDRIKGPFDPSNIQYIERDLAWEVFNTRLQSN